MTSEGNSQRIKRRVLTPQIRDTIVQESSEADYWIEEDEHLARLDTTRLRDSLSKRRLSKKDMEFNRRVLHIREIAHRHIDLVRLWDQRYHCSRIMALSLAIRELKWYAEETRQLFRRATDVQDKEALGELIHLLDARAGRTYWEDLLLEAKRVGAVRSWSSVQDGRVVTAMEDPDYDLIEARFALDAIWDEQRSMRAGTSEHNQRLARKRSRELHGDPKVEKARRSLDIPPDGFKDLDAAHQWALTRSPDWSRRDDAYWQELVWWESFTWDPVSQRPLARGYILLDLPALNEAVESLVDEHQLRPNWSRALPLYLIRGRLEPPPKMVFPRPSMEKVHQEIYELSKKHKPCWKAVTYFRYRLTDEDWSEIARLYPAANKKRWSWGEKQRIAQMAERIARRKGTLDSGRAYLTIEERFEQYFRKVCSRMKARKKM